MIAGWLKSLRVFLAWLVGFGLMLVVLALSHELFLMFIVNTLHWEKYLVRFMNMLYYFPAGIVCIAFFVFLYPYLDRSDKKDLLLRNTLRVVGILLLLISLIQIGLLGYRYLPASTLNLSYVLAEILAAALCFFISYQMRKPV
jgi:quinol-cytochrome oxidoreductase complex cytochrome b subunit